MSRNGTGTYSAPGSTWNPPVNGVTATAADWAALLADLSTALTQSVAVDGQSPMTGNLPMGGNKVTGMANGTATTDAAAYGQLNLNCGQCRVSVSGANLLLLPYQGNKLTINGVVCTIPAAGITLSTASLSASTAYNIYAVATGTAVSSMEASTTAHATDSSTGVEVKSGDATRTLVAKARTNGSTAWVDSVSQRFLINWFNRRQLSLAVGLGSDTGNAGGTTYSEITSALRAEFLKWADDGGYFVFEGALYSNVQHAVSSTALSLDGTVGESYNAGAHYQVSAIIPLSVSLEMPSSTSEGYHYVSPFSKQNVVSTATYVGSGTAGARCATKGLVWG